MIETGFLHAPHQFGGTHAVRPRESMDRSERRTLYTAFDSTQLCSVDSKFLVYIKLRKTCLVSNLTQHASKCLFRA